MGAKEIAKKIRKHTIYKTIIVVALIVDLCLFLVGFIFEKNSTFTIIKYFLMIGITIIAYLFPLNATLSKNISVNDYSDILEYMSNISNEMSKQQYFDGLIMIRNSLDEIVHYKMNDAEQYIKDNIWYLQGQFHKGDTINTIPSDLYNRTYTSDLCTKLIEQMKNHTFNATELENIRCSDEPKINFKKRIELQYICNVILAGLVIYKVYVSLNTSAYDAMNNDVVKRLVYNVGADIIAVVVIVINYLRTKEK